MPIKICSAVLHQEMYLRMKVGSLWQRAFTGPSMFSPCIVLSRFLEMILRF
jgi:hypothetical protein